MAQKMKIEWVNKGFEEILLFIRNNGPGESGDR